MHGLYAAHSGLRYLVLLVGLVAVVVASLGLVRNRPWSKAGRVLGSVFVIALDVQVMLGLAMAFMGRAMPGFMGHLGLMISAAVVGHVFNFLNKKKAQPEWRFLLFAVLGALSLVVLGIQAIGRSPVQSIRYYATTPE